MSKRNEVQYAELGWSHEFQHEYTSTMTLETFAQTSVPSDASTLEWPRVSHDSAAGDICFGSVQPLTELPYTPVSDSPIL